MKSEKYKPLFFSLIPPVASLSMGEAEPGCRDHLWLIASSVLL